MTGGFAKIMSLRKTLGAATVKVIHRAWKAGAYRDLDSLRAFLAKRGWDANHLMAPIASFFGYVCDDRDLWIKFWKQPPRALHPSFATAEVASAICLRQIAMSIHWPRDLKSDREKFIWLQRRAS